MSPHRLLLATRNKGKIEEFRRILEDIAAGQIELVGLDQFPSLHDVAETGSTFQENALLKAREMCAASGIAAIADDSGLCVDFLNGDPGIYSARWAGVHGDDAANTLKVLNSLEEQSDDFKQKTIRVSGSLENHYAPKAQVFLDQPPVSGSGFIALENIETPDGVIRLAAPTSVEEFARVLYSALREGDHQSLDSIYLAQPTGDGLAIAIRDRLSRSAEGR